MNNDIENINDDEKGFITKKEKGTGAFEDLYLQGIGMLQNLSGDVWTDYNLHDPGVTILENLSFALTGLEYLADQPIQDLLVQGKKGQLKSGDNGFFIPSDILTINPVTIKDFRKIMIDQVVNLKNAWFERLNDTYTSEVPNENMTNTKGLYHIFVELHRYANDPKTRQKENIKIKEEVSKLFHSHRNLCEDLYEITILKPLKLQMSLVLTVNDLVNGEEILAEIFYKIRNRISLDPKFRALWELQSEEVDINTIFNGPHLENGFIEDNQLRKRFRKILFSDLVSIINKFKNVISVDAFDLKVQMENYNDTDLKQAKNGELLIPMGYAPILELPLDKKQLSYKNEGITFTPDLEAVKKKLSYIEARNYGSFKSVSKSSNIIEIPKGREPYNLEHYPVRKQFPRTYGIGDYGLSNDASKLRQAQVKQLKAYLLPLDQLMANFTAQLTNIYTLYEVKEHEMQSYFYKELEDMPELTELIKENEFQPDAQALEKWKKTLKELHKSYDTNAVNRLNNAADSLLARFGETFPDYSLRKMQRSVYGTEDRDENLEKHLLALKRTLIRDYAQLSYNRAKAYDYTQSVELMGDSFVGDDEQKLIPGLVQKVALLLGISNIGIRSFTKLVEDADIKIYRKTRDPREWEHQNLEIIYTDETVEALEYDDVVIIDEEVTDLHGAFYFYGNKDSILQDIFKNGVIASNYEIKSNSGKHHPSYYILFKYEKHRARVAHISHSFQEASEALSDFIARLKRVNERSEGFYMIEHLLLSPPYKSNSYGYEFAIDTGEGLCLNFTQHELVNMDVRNKNSILLNDNFHRDGSLQFRSINNAGNYEIQILSSTGDQLAVSTEKYSYKEESETAIAKMVVFVRKFEVPGNYLKLKFKTYYGSEKVDETFFSHKMCFVFPSWPARLQDPNFKARIRNVILEEYPAHICFDSIWLGFDEMKEFEENYFKWIQVVSDNALLENQLDCAYALIKIIKKYFLKKARKKINEKS